MWNIDLVDMHSSLLFGLNQKVTKSSRLHRIIAKINGLSSRRYWAQSERQRSAFSTSQRI
jgi:hypothetical protein